MKIIIFLTLATILVAAAILTSGEEPTEYYIEETDTQVINDSKVYMSATPAHSKGELIYEEFISKLFEGDITVAYGFDTDTTKPKSLDIYSNKTIITEKNYTCDYEFEYTLDPKWFNCYIEHAGYDSNGTWVEPKNQSIFNHSFLTGNIPSKTVFWEEESIVGWKDFPFDTTKITYDYGGMNTWWVAKDVPVKVNVSYKSLLNLEYKFNLEPQSGKYWKCVMPSSYGRNIGAAKDAGHLYCLDPWWNETWGYSYSLTMSSSQNREIYIINTTGTECETDPDSTRIVSGDNTTTFPYRWQNSTKTTLAFIGDNSSNYFLYCDDTSTIAEGNSTNIITEWFGCDGTESQATGWTNSGGGSIACATDRKKYGAESLKISNGDTRSYYNSIHATGELVSVTGWVNQQIGSSGGMTYPKMITNNDQTGDYFAWVDQLGYADVTYSSNGGWTDTGVSWGNDDWKTFHMSATLTDGIANGVFSFNNNIKSTAIEQSGVADIGVNWFLMKGNRGGDTLWYDNVFICSERCFIYNTPAVITRGPEQTAPVSSDCIYSGSGDWEISEACTIQEDTNVSNNNIFIYAVGVLNNATVNNINSLISNGSFLNIANGRVN